MISVVQEAMCSPHNGIQVVSLFMFGWPKLLVLVKSYIFPCRLWRTSTRLAFLGGSCCRTGTSGNSTSVWILTAITAPSLCSRDVETTLEYFEGSPQIQHGNQCCCEMFSQNKIK